MQFFKVRLLDGSVIEGKTLRECNQKAGGLPHIPYDQKTVDMEKLLRKVGEIDMNTLQIVWNGRKAKLLVFPLLFVATGYGLMLISALLAVMAR